MPPLKRAEDKLQCTKCGMLVDPMINGKLPKHKDSKGSKWAWCFNDKGKQT